MTQQAQATRVEDEDQDGGNGMLAVAASRAAQEVQAAMVIARRWPRNETEAIRRIKTSCQRPKLAEASQYEFPRGGTKITGPSIRLAEVLAQNWGNIDSGVIELERRDGESTAMSYAWDLETNTRDVKIFTVRHIRDKKGGGERLKDERDIYELIANMGARRKRACILAVIPVDVQETAIEECDKTLVSGQKGPIIDRIRAMLEAFREFGVTTEMIEAKFQHRHDSLSELELVRLRKIYASIRDGVAAPHDHFEFQAQTSGGSVSEQTQQWNERFGLGGKGKVDVTKTGVPPHQGDLRPQQEREEAAQPRATPTGVQDPDFNRDPHREERPAAPIPTTQPEAAPAPQTTPAPPPPVQPAPKQDQDAHPPHPQEGSQMNLGGQQEDAQAAPKPKGKLSYDDVESAVMSLAKQRGVSEDDADKMLASWVVAIGYKLRTAKIPKAILEQGLEAATGATGSFAGLKAK